MSASYSGNPNSTPKDGIRFLVGDTGPTSFDFTDEEILFAIKTQANMWMAAALFCDKQTTLKSSGGLASKSVGGLSESYSQGSIAFYESQAKLFRTLGSAHQVPTIADISQKFSFRQFDGLGGRGPRVRDDEDWPPKDEEQL